MADQSREMARTGSEHSSMQDMPSHLRTSQRKSSFSETLNKFTSSTFHRRRTDTVLPSLTSSISNPHPSYIPTPDGINRSSSFNVNRSTSFFSNLNTISSKTTPSASDERPQLLPTKRSRKISERLAQAPFFSHQYQQQPTSTPRRRRESSVKIEQRGLMQPVHPPLPSSNTMANLAQSQQSSPHTPSFMRPTTSSARRSSGVGRRNIAAALGSKTPTQARQTRATPFPTRSASLVPAPTSTTDAKQSDTPIDYSDGANFQVSNQHAQEGPMDSESRDDQEHQSPANHTHETRPAPPAQESKKSILTSNGKNSKLSEVLSNLYVEDEPDTSKEERDNEETKLRSNQASPAHSERTATPESSNPQLVRNPPSIFLPPIASLSSPKKPHPSSHI